MSSVLWSPLTLLFLLFMKRENGLGIAEGLNLRDLLGNVVLLIAVI